MVDFVTVMQFVLCAVGGEFVLFIYVGKATLTYNNNGSWNSVIESVIAAADWDGRECGSWSLGFDHHGCVKVNEACVWTSCPRTCVLITKYSIEGLALRRWPVDPYVKLELLKLSRICCRAKSVTDSWFMVLMVVVGPAIAQGVSRRPPTAEAWVRSQASVYGACGGQSGNQTGLSPSTSLSSVSIVTQGRVYSYSS